MQLDLQIVIDIDNTIINYDPIFNRICSRFKLRPSHINHCLKTFLKETIYACNSTHTADKIWQRIQAAVYGNLSDNAILFTGALEFLEQFGKNVKLVSHKTTVPYNGPAIKLREKCIQNLERLGILKFVSLSNIEMLETIVEKIKYINSLNPDLWVDDLLHPLQSKDAPDCLKIHFSNEKNEFLTGRIITLNCWAHISDFLNFSNLPLLKLQEIRKIASTKNTVFANTQCDPSFIKLFSDFDIKSGRLYREAIHRRILTEKYNFNTARLLAEGQTGVKLESLNAVNLTVFSEITLAQLREQLVIMESIKHNDKIMDATDSIKRTSDYLEIIDRRIIDLENNFSKVYYEEIQVLKFLNQLAKKKAVIKLNLFKIDSESIIKNRCFCLPDLSLENLLVNEKIYLIDFESSGFDDSVKMASNIFHHPKFKMQLNDKINLLKVFIEVFNDQNNEWLKRFYAIQDLWAVNWLCLILKYAIKSNSFTEYQKRKKFYLSHCGFYGYQ